mgnify:FL=1
MQDKQDRCDIDIAEAESLSTSVANQQPCDNDEIFLVGDQVSN